MPRASQLGVSSIAWVEPDPCRYQCRHLVGEGKGQSHTAPSTTPTTCGVTMHGTNNLQSRKRKLQHVGHASSWTTASARQPLVRNRAPDQFILDDFSRPTSRGARALRITTLASEPWPGLQGVLLPSDNTCRASVHQPGQGVPRKLAAGSDANSYDVPPRARRPIRGTGSASPPGRAARFPRVQGQRRHSNRRFIRPNIGRQHLRRERSSHTGLADPVIKSGQVSVSRTHYLQEPMR